MAMMRIHVSRWNRRPAERSIDSRDISMLEYCAPLFIGLSKCRARKLENVFFRFHRLLRGDDHKTCYTTLKALMNVGNRQLWNFFNKSLSKTHILHHISSVISPSGRILLPVTKTNFRLNSFFEQASRIFNRNFVRKWITCISFLSYSYLYI